MINNVSNGSNCKLLSIYNKIKYRLNISIISIIPINNGNNCSNDTFYPKFVYIQIGVNHTIISIITIILARTPIFYQVKNEWC